MDVQERFMADNDQFRYEFIHHMPPKLGGLAHNKTIYIDAKRDYRERTAILAEEVAHEVVSGGDIADYSIPINRKSETWARRYALKQLVPLSGLVNAWKDAAVCISDIADYLEVPNDSVENALKAYRAEYGERFMYDGYQFDLSNGLRITD
jgi:hypothetical protein